MLAATLIPRYGTIGAAVATSGALVTQGLLAHLVFVRAGAVGRMTRGHRGVYASIAVAVGALALIRFATGLGLIPFAFVAAVIMLLVVRYNRQTLEIERTFPEMAKIPILGRVLGLKRRL